MYNGGMTSSRTRAIIVLISGIGIAAAALSILLSSCRGYRCINIPDAHFVIADTYEDTKTAWRGTMKSGDQLLRIKLLHNIPASQSEEITTIHKTALLGMYDVSLSPYPGAISQTVRCDASFKPVPKTITGVSGQTITYFSGFLNARLQYGSCVESQIMYRGFTGILYCEQLKKWVQVELIVPKDSAVSDADGERFMQSVSCKKQ